MWLIILKLMLAILLTTIPFAIHFLSKSDSKYRNIFCTLKTGASHFKKKLDRIQEGLRKRTNVRKFFVAVTLLFILLVQFLDFNVSTDIARTVVRERLTTGDAMSFYLVYGPFLTTPTATCISACMAFSLFFYRVADYLLSSLYAYPKFFFFWSVITITFALSSPRNFIISETCFIILVASYFYPPKDIDFEPATSKEKPSDEHLYNAA